MKKIIEFNIFGKSYKIKVDESVEDTEEIVQSFLKTTAKMQKFLGKNSRLADTKILILTCLDLINNFLKLKKQHKELQKKINNNSLEIIKTIDKTIKSVE